MNCIEEEVVVEYGADNPSSECGSGFPTEKTRHLFPDDDVSSYVSLRIFMSSAENMNFCIGIKPIPG